jgi:hypothetical protein
MAKLSRCQRLAAATTNILKHGAERGPKFAEARNAPRVANHPRPIRNNTDLARRQVSGLRAGLGRGFAIRLHVSHVVQRSLGAKWLLVSMII